ncbi:MAG: helix-turn-helix domain-containing protein [Candidatus Pacearchaeota archaeon]|jgi:DNA-binding transcriptional ArsR family regulator
MVEEKFLMVSMDDPKSKKIAEVLGSESCKKIIDYLADKDEASAKDLSDALKMPLNTLDYNLKKLLSSGILEKKNNFFWSSKGKKIVMYGLSNKSILISPKKSKLNSKIKSIIPVAFVAGLGTILVGIFSSFKRGVQNSIDVSKDAVLKTSSESSGIISQNSPFYISSTYPAWIWFLSGAVIVLLIFSILNWRKL